MTCAGYSLFPPGLKPCSFSLIYASPFPFLASQLLLPLGKKMRMKESLFAYWNILDHFISYAQRICPYVVEVWPFKKFLIGTN